MSDIMAQSNEDAIVAERNEPEGGWAVITGGTSSTATGCYVTDNGEIIKCVNIDGLMIMQISRPQTVDPER